MPVFHDLTVARLEPLTDDAMAITLAVPAELAEAYRFRPGQHLTFRHTVGDEEIRRTFSIYTTPRSGKLAVAVKLLPGGSFSTFVRSQLRVGDQLSVMTPAGRFGPRLPVPEGAAPTYVAVVAGSGITPVLSILASVLESNPLATFVLMYGNRTQFSVMFADEIADLKDSFLERFQVFHVLSQEDHDAPLLTGRIDKAKLETLLELHPPERVHEWFLCGPAGLVEQARETLTGAGVDRRRVHRELFYLGTPAELPSQPASGGGTVAASGGGTVTATLHGRTTTFPMPATGSVLDAVLRVRPDAPFACKGGVCGTCRMKVVAGSAEMVENYALDAEDVEAGFRLACQSVPTSGDLVVDFDG